MTDYDPIDFFRGSDLVDDPYPYFDWLRKQCPVRRETHHDVMMVTGFDEASYDAALAALDALRARGEAAVEARCRALAEREFALPTGVERYDA